MRARVNQEVPATPGIYRFLDREGSIIYIGKSVNLRRRMASYLTESLEGMEGRTRRMVYNAADFSFQATTSELEALMLEDRLIKEQMPPYNIRQKQMHLVRYLYLTEDRFPALRAIDYTQKQDRTRVFGPFRNGYLVENLLELISRHFKLRSCAGSLPGCGSRKTSCINHELGLCVGACRGAVSPEDYARLVQRVTRFLEGDDSEIVVLLNEIMSRDAASLAYEHAARTRDLLEFCERFCRRQRFLRAFERGTIVVREEGKPPSTHFFHHGIYRHCKGKLTERRMEKEVDLLRRRSHGGVADDRITFDRAEIVYRWLQRNRSEMLVL